MTLVILLVLLVPAGFLLTFVAVAMWKTLRMGDDTPGWASVHRRLPIYKFPSKDRPVKLWPDSHKGHDDTDGSER